jgi:hypothetical protein
MYLGLMPATGSSVSQDAAKAERLLKQACTADVAIARAARRSE